MLPTRADGGRVLVVDDEVEMAQLLADKLIQLGYQVQMASTGDEAIAWVRTRPFDTVVSDLRMAGTDGFDVLRASKATDPNVPVLLMTAFGAVESAIEAMKLGAFHYLTKPFRLEEAVIYIERAVSERRLRDENSALRRLAGASFSMADIVGRSHSMRELSQLIERVAGSEAPILVRGETGTGKELVAKAIHALSPRASRPFVAVNCSALPEALLESELFGHVRGAFTGATTARRGLFAEADGGTLFLDEIGDMPLSLQPKLLRVLEDGEVRAVGADGPRRVDIRLIAATHQDVQQRVQEGRFRADLFFRLNVVPLQVPSLRSRAEDIGPLAEHFLARAVAKGRGAKVRSMSAEVLVALSRYPWPGNVRELENLVERLVIISGKEVVDFEELERHAPSFLSGPSPLEQAHREVVPLRKLESDYITWVVNRCAGNKTRAAELLEIDVSTIHRRERSSS